MAAFLCANFVALVLLSWMPSFLHDKFNLGLAASGLTATLFVQLASMAGAPAGGWWADVLRRTVRARSSDKLASLIASGILQVGDELPSERELASRRVQKSQ